MENLQVLFLFAILAATYAVPIVENEAQPCDVSKCKLPNCRCIGTDIPGNLSPADTPQFVFLTYDDAVNDQNFNYYVDALVGRTNPDGCNVSATLFLSHNYTVYSKVHELYENGFEVALHSITHQSPQDYWKHASVDTLKNEFGGERELISKFAKIPADSIKGMRLPFLQLSGNNSFETLKELNLTYDCSWPTQTYIHPGLWPYTLDYESYQDCPIGPCPTASIPGAWVVPMLDLKDIKNASCAMLDQCTNIPQNPNDVVEWLKTNFNRNYNGNKAPFGLFMHATWFITDPGHLDIYKTFVDYLQTLKDVYIVTIDRAVEWIKNPVPLNSADWPKCPQVIKSDCIDQACRYVQQDKSEIYMHICASDDNKCPANYPSPSDPLGEGN